MLWRDEFSCFDEEIDNQHKKLFEIADRLLAVVKKSAKFDCYDEILSVFKELSDYTVYHFGYEEKLFEQFKYDELNKRIHLDEHVKFIKKVGEIDADSLDSDQKRVTTEVVLFVINWVEEHILQTDKKFGIFRQTLKSLK